jgi:YHS domain-containing protein
MFKVFKKKKEKDPVCGMVANENFISKHGEKFCSENCVKVYEEEKIVNENTKSAGCSCCH